MPKKLQLLGEPEDKHLRPLLRPLVICFARQQLLGKLTGNERCFDPSENRVKWSVDNW